MPGALPSGSDPSYQTPHPFSVIGAGMSVLQDRTEDNVRPILEEQVRSDPGISNLSASVFAGLNPALGLPVAIIKAALQAIAGVPLNIIGGGLQALFGAFAGIPASQIQDRPTENIVFNPQFNVDLTGWTSSGVSPSFDYTQDPTEGRTGPGSAKVTATSVSKTLRSTRIPVIEGNTVTVSAWHKVDSGSAVAGPVRVNVRLLDGNGTYISTQNIGVASGIGTTDWAEITNVPITINSTTKFIEVELKIEYTMHAGTVWWDDVSVIKSGKIPQNMITGLVEALSATVQTLIDAFFGAPGFNIPIFSDFLKLLGGLFPALVPRGDGTAEETPLTQQNDRGDGTAIITGGLGSLMHLVDGTAQTVVHAVSGFLNILGIHQGTLNAVTSGLNGNTGGTGQGMSTVNDVQVATQNAAAALAANTAQILALTQTTSSAVASIDFTSLADATSLAGLNFNQIYAGPAGTASNLGIIKARATWDIINTSFPDQWRSCLAIKNDVATTGDDQLIGVSYSTTPDNKTNDYIIGRANLTGDTFVLADFTNGRLELSCTVSGVKTIFTSKPFSKKANTRYYLKCGPGRQFNVLENTTNILSYTEPGTTSAMGSGFRRAGFGGRSNTSVFYFWVPVQLQPGKVTAFSISNA